MNSIKTSKLVLAALAVAASALMLAPTAAADPAIFVGDITSPAAPLTPELGAGTVTIPFTYQLDNAAYNLAGAAQSAVSINFRFDCVDGVEMSGALTRILPIEPTGAPTANFPGSASFTVAVTRDAPGLKLLNCNIFMSANSVSQVAPAVDERNVASFKVKADYFPLISSGVAGSSIKQAGPQKNVNFDVTVNNFGNAKTQVVFSIVDEPSSGKWEVLTPDPLILDTPNGGTEATQGTGTISVSTTYKNGWNNEKGALKIRMTAKTTEDPSNLNIMEIDSNMLVRVRGVYVPGLEPIVLLGAVLGTALLARRRSE